MIIILRSSLATKLFNSLLFKWTFTLPRGFYIFCHYFFCSFPQLLGSDLMRKMIFRILNFLLTRNSESQSSVICPRMLPALSFRSIECDSEGTGEDGDRMSETPLLHPSKKHGLVPSCPETRRPSGVTSVDLRELFQTQEGAG